MIKVSVIIPIYGVEKFIERCANSLFSQTLNNIEFIFIDDCSPDKSMEILQSVIEKNRRHIIEKEWVVRTERMSKNSGQAAVRKWGIELAVGDFVIQCDSDDWVASNMYEVLYNKAISNDADIVICRAFITDGNNHTFSSRVSFSIDKLKQIELMLRLKASNSLCMKLIRRSIFTNNNIKYPVANSFEDGTLSIQVIYYANKYLLINEPYYYYYSNQQSTTRKVDVEMCIKRMQGGGANIAICEDFLREVHLESKYRNLIACMRFRSRMNLVPALEDKQAKELFISSYPGANMRALLSPYISLKLKLRYVYYYFFVFISLVLTPKNN